MLLRFAAPRLREEPGHVELWDGESTLPRQTVVRLKAGECMLRDGKTIHRGHAQPGERLTLAGGESLSLRVAVVFTQPSVGFAGWSGQPFVNGQRQKLRPSGHGADGTPIVARGQVDARDQWQLDPQVREALPHGWMRAAWDRWALLSKPEG